MSTIKAVVKNALNKLFKDGAKGGFVVFKVDSSANYYVQFRIEIERTELYGECVSNRYLAEGHALGEVGIEILEDAGWAAPSEGLGENYHQTIPLNSAADIDELAAQTVMILASVFGLETIDHLKVKLFLGDG